MEWHRDRRLQRRMVLALALTVVSWAGLLGPVFWVLGLELGLVVAGVVLLFVLVLAREADRLAYLITKAIAISHNDYPKLFETTARLARQADVARPAVAVIPTDDPNALSAGIGDRTVICVTLGLLKTLDDEELEAVLAHEFAHLKNGDSAVLTTANFPATVAVTLVNGGIRNLGSRALLLGYAGAAIYLVLLGIPLLVVSLPGTLVLSRYREYAADRGAVAITGNPTALSLALGKIHCADPKPETDLRRVAGLNAFCIVPPRGRLLVPWTHPPTHRRMRRLRHLAAELEGTAPPDDGS
ncbi:M48 family metalloprotease [Halorientalis brevis]|uniref:M48 family metalloprotease n=1 Tax=Halorientalis brevis TaxID=1126241 RepID=A0ABD6C8E9_9EURY|nr:M48 family metalloprotease [Halorientalis brevis]